MSEKAGQILGSIVLGCIGLILVAGTAWVVSRIAGSMLGGC